MKTIINYASGKPSNPLRGYSYVHDSKLRQPRQIAATMHKMLSVTTATIRYGRLYLTVTGPPTPSPEFPLHPLQTDTKQISNLYKLKSVCYIKPQNDHYSH